MAEAKKDIKHIEFEGFELDVDMDNFDDVEFFTLSDEAQTNPGKLIDIAKLAFGEEGYKALKAYFVKKDGKLALSKLSAIYEKIFQAEDPKESASGTRKANTQTN